MADYDLVVMLFVTLFTAPVWLYIIFNKPRIYFASYLLLTTRFFGFMPISVSGRVNALLFPLHCIMILAVAVVLIKSHRFPNKKITQFLVFIFGMICFGVLYPFFNGFSSVGSSVVDGKDMFGYAGLAYLVVNNRHFDFDWFFMVFSVIGTVLASIIIFGYLTGYCPPSYFRIGDSRVLQVSYITYISLAAVMVASRMLNRNVTSNMILLFAILMCGLLIQGHRSVLLSTLLVVILLFLTRAHISLRHVCIIIGIPFILIIHLASGGKYLTNIVLEPITELRDTSVGAIASRNIVNAIRYRYIAERPFLGYGFIDETSSLGWEIEEESTSQFNQSLGVVDSGYVDLSIRFGIVGAVLFCLAWGGVLFEPLRNARSLGNGQFALALFLAMYFPMNYTFSVFTYAPGIICSCAAIFLLFYNGNNRVGN